MPVAKVSLQLLDESGLGAGMGAGDDEGRQALVTSDGQRYSLQPRERVKLLAL